jgi:hypothetical protein
VQRQRAAVQRRLGRGWLLAGVELDMGAAQVRASAGSGLCGLR